MGRDVTGGSVGRSGDKSDLGRTHERRVSSNFCYWLPAQAVDATLYFPKGKERVYEGTSKIFARLHCDRENGDFGIAGSVRQDLGIQTAAERVR